MIDREKFLKQQNFAMYYWPEGFALQAQFIDALREILGLGPMPGKWHQAPSRDKEKRCEPSQPSP